MTSGRRTPFCSPKRKIKDAISRADPQDLHDIEFAQQQIRNFAEKQKESLRETETETLPGVWLGHKHIPIERVGLLCPGRQISDDCLGAYEHGDGKSSGSATHHRHSPAARRQAASSGVAAMHKGGADHILTLGGIQALAAMAFGTEGLPPADMLVGPGNAYVAEAKRQLFGRVGIDLLAGPTETLILADDSADGEICATDLLGQAEHGPNSPAVLVTDSRQLAEDTIRQAEKTSRPDANRRNGRHRLAGLWRGHPVREQTRDVGYGKQTCLRAVQVMTGDDDYFLNNLTNYGALFLGQRTNVAYGDKVIGTNHTLPTGRAARYTGGLWVGKFLKTCTWQRVESDSASAEIGSYCSRPFLMEGFAGHAEQANIRVRRFGGKHVKPYSPAKKIN